MILEHGGKRPRIHASAYVAPNATICGEVTVGAESRVLFGAVLTAESGPVTIGERCIIMENAVIRGVAHNPASLGHHVLVGPHAHLSGCRVEDDVFIATGACIFNGAAIGARARHAQGRPHCRALRAASSRARSSSPASTAGSASPRARPTWSSAWRPTRRAAAST